MLKTVNDLYIHAKYHNSKLLSDYNATFWGYYRNNYQNFDRYFKTKFKTFEIREQEPDDETISVLSNFNNNVTDFLMVNEKRYNELYRVQVVTDDENYNILENYYLEETYTGTGTNKETHTGSQNLNEVHNGSQNLNENYSGNVDNQSTSASGQRTDVTNFEQGNQKQSALNSVSAFNTNSLNSKDKNESEVGTRNDVTQYTEGGQELTNHATNTDTHSITNTNTDSHTTTNTNTDSHTTDNINNDSHTLVRHGAIGTMTADDVLEKHINLWQKHFDFYNLIFDEIAEFLLKVGC